MLTYLACNYTLDILTSVWIERMIRISLKEGAAEPERLPLNPQASDFEDMEEVQFKNPWEMTAEERAERMKNIKPVNYTEVDNSTQPATSFPLTPE